VIRSRVEDLLLLDEEAWRRWAFRREPLRGRIPARDLDTLCGRAEELGRRTARELRSRFPGSAPSGIAASLGLRILERTGEGEYGGTLFAFYDESDAITVFKDKAEAADRLIASEGLEDLVGTAPVAEILIAHELFHALDRSGADPDSPLLLPGPAGPFRRRRPLRALEELAAMEFARELLRLPCPAWIFTLVLLYPADPSGAEAVHRGMMGMGGAGSSPTMKG
jgi:hypothetical protein